MSVGARLPISVLGVTAVIVMIAGVATDGGSASAAVPPPVVPPVTPVKPAAPVPPVPQSPSNPAAPTVGQPPIPAAPSVPPPRLLPPPVDPVPPLPSVPAVPKSAPKPADPKSVAVKGESPQPPAPSELKAAGTNPTADPGGTGLRVFNIRACSSPAGDVRADLKLRPYDQVFFCYELAGLTTDAAGEAELGVSVRLTGPDGKTTGGDPAQARVPLLLGGDRLQSNVTALFTAEQQPGIWRMQVRITDVAAGKSVEFQRDVELLPAVLGAVSVNFTGDLAGEYPLTSTVPLGQAVYLRFLATGFAVTATRAEVDVWMQVLDVDGKPTHARPMVQTFKAAKPEEVKDLRFITVVNRLVLHRAGDYKVRIQIADRVAGKSSETIVPFKVRAAE